MRNTPLLIVCLILAFSILSCEQRPEGILSKGEMEDVLYDYHLAQAMADWVPGHEGESNQPYLDAVFRKHGITQAEFDSSLVWYNAHASDLKYIYESLKDRFTFESQKLQIEAGDKEMATLIVEGGDTTNLWNGRVSLCCATIPCSIWRSFRSAAIRSFSQATTSNSRPMSS